MKRTPQGRGLGWRPDTPDQRDLLYGDIARLKLAHALPRSMDLRHLQRPIDDQGRQGSCVAQGCTRAHETVWSIDKGLSESVDFSRAFLYYNARAAIDTENEDSGCQIRDAIKSLAKLGNCFEFNLPYNDRIFAESPPHICYTQALEFQITSYYRLQNTRLRELLTCLADGYPFVFGATLYESFERVGSDGVVSMPSWSEAALGGHCMTAVGYDQEAKLFTVANSWSAAWGDAGYCYMPFDYLMSRSLASDFWTIRAGENV